MFYWIFCRSKSKVLYIVDIAFALLLVNIAHKVYECIFIINLGTFKEKVLIKAFLCLVRLSLESFFILKSKILYEILAILRLFENKFADFSHHDNYFPSLSNNGVKDLYSSLIISKLLIIIKWIK